MSIQRRPKTGKDKNGRVRWVARYRDTAGREHAKTFDTKTDAKAWETEQLRALRTGTWVDPKDQQITLRAVVQEFADSSTRPGTEKVRINLLKSLGPMGEVPIGELRPAMISAWVADLQRGPRPLAANTVANRFSMLRTALNRAVDQQLIPRNPAARIKAPSQVTHVSADGLPTPGQVARLIRVWRDGDDEMGVPAREDMALAMSVAAQCGHRLGEVLGLRPCDLSVVAQTVRVAQQRGGRPLKTESSRRVVSADPGLISDLLAYAERCGVGDRSEVFGELSSAFVGDAMRRSRKVGLVPVGCTFHTLRHFHATQLLSAGVPVKAVAARLGHANAAMTLRVYAHVLEVDDVRAASVVGDLLRAECGMDGRGGGGLRAV
ncbi:tyrosine-type recombinase/integrase [Corynebacterium pygosceleis]|uniref:tyrosine-type recombinase/integrase n=1 Tax=Corynebacterium pygosceleis TaxID=2800406 RepID=UPI00200638C5|nr:site-specific integrase [Corynebacterium pygosceleis]MCK7676199.1 site-specific integrase [Corynebacterium pygosceleis]